MRIVSGYVFIWETPEDFRTHRLLGPSWERGVVDIQENDLTPFSSLDALKSTTPPYRGAPANITLYAAETQEDMNSFPGNDSFIIIQSAYHISKRSMRDYENGHKLLGRIPLGRQMICDWNCMELYENGILPFTNLAETIRSAQEVLRQAGSPVSIAYFQLDRLEK